MRRPGRSALTDSAAALRHRPDANLAPGTSETTVSRQGAELFSDKIDAVASFARGLGVDVREAVPLRSTNNVVIHLRPSPVVAKIGVGRQSQLRLDLDVAVELAALGGPVIATAPGIPAIVHSCG